MKGSLTHELEVSLPADEVWEVYGSLRLAELVVELLPNIISKVVAKEGDGGAGTVLRLTLPGNDDLQKRSWSSKRDNEKRLKETVVVEGGYLDIGFTSYLVRFEIQEKGNDSSIIKSSSIEYELEEEHAANASPWPPSLEPFLSISLKRKPRRPSALHLPHSGLDYEASTR